MKRKIRRIFSVSDDEILNYEPRGRSDGVDKPDGRVCIIELAGPERITFLQMRDLSETFSTTGIDVVQTENENWRLELYED